MNVWEMIYNLAEFYFSTIWLYLGLLLLIFVVRGDVTRAIYSVRNFFAKAKEKYQQRLARLASDRYLKRNIPKDLRNSQKQPKEEE